MPRRGQRGRAAGGLRGHGTLMSGRLFRAAHAVMARVRTSFAGKACDGESSRGPRARLRSEQAPLAFRARQRLTGARHAPWIALRPARLHRRGPTPGRRRPLGCTQARPGIVKATPYVASHLEDSSFQPAQTSQGAFRFLARRRPCWFPRASCKGSSLVRRWSRKRSCIHMADDGRNDPSPPVSQDTGLTRAGTLSLRCDQAGHPAA